MRRSLSAFETSAAPTGVKRAQSTLRAMQLRYLDELHQVDCCIFRFLGQYDILQRAQLPRVRTVTMGMRRPPRTRRQGSMQLH